MIAALSALVGMLLTKGVDVWLQRPKLQVEARVTSDKLDLDETQALRTEAAAIRKELREQVTLLREEAKRQQATIEHLMERLAAGENAREDLERQVEALRIEAVTLQRRVGELERENDELRDQIRTAGLEPVRPKPRRPHGRPVVVEG